MMSDFMTPRKHVNFLAKKVVILFLALASFISVDAQKVTKEQLLQDYNYFIQHLEQIHPDPYSAFGGKEAFHQTVRNLRDNLAKRDSLTLDEMKFEGNVLLSTLHDGHTNMGWAEIPETMPDAFLPLRFRVIPDGIIVHGSLPEWKSLIGAYVREVGGMPLDSVLTRIDHISTTENRFGQYKMASSFIRYNNTVKLLFPDFDGKQLSMKLHLVSGRDTIVSLPFYPNGSLWDSFIHAPEDSRFPKGNFEYRFVDDQKQTMVIRINQVISADIPDKSLRADNDTTETEESRVIVADVFARMLREMQAASSPRLIIDLRGNGGGWTPIMYAAFYELFGQRFFDTDMSFHYATKLSEMYLKKNGITLEQFNQQRGTNLSLGDFSVERKIESFDEFMCADMSILKALNDQPIYTPKDIYVVTDEHTFSAAFHITYMMWRMGAKVVGVPSSQAPNTFMEVTPFNLPNSGLECCVSNSLQRCFPDNDPRAKVFTPDIQLTYDDYRKYNFSKDAELLYLIEKDREYYIKTTDGVTLYAHVRGHGAPCLYLHGGPGAGSTWMKEMGGEELEKRFTMIYFDQRGFCKSTAPANDNFSLSRQTLDFEEVRKALGIEKWFLLGHSFGGILEIGYWRDYPNSICGMIFEDCTLSMNECFKDSWLPAALEIVGDKVDPVAKDTTAALPARMAAIQKSLNDDTRALIFTDGAHKQVIDTLNSWTFHKECVCHTDGEKVMMIEDYWTDFRPLASTVTVPVLFFVGKKDRAIGPDSYKDAHFPNAIIRIGNCGHFPFIESPKEWAAALDDYFTFIKE